jgi:hypothetical protein
VHETALNAIGLDLDLDLLKYLHRSFTAELRNLQLAN